MWVGRRVGQIVGPASWHTRVELLWFWSESLVPPRARVSGGARTQLPLLREPMLARAPNTHTHTHTSAGGCETSAAPGRDTHTHTYLTGVTLLLLPIPNTDDVLGRDGGRLEPAEPHVGARAYGSGRGHRTRDAQTHTQMRTDDPPISATYSSVVFIAELARALVRVNACKLYCLLKTTLAQPKLTRVYRHEVNFTLPPRERVATSGNGKYSVLTRRA